MDDSPCEVFSKSKYQGEILENGQMCDSIGIRAETVGETTSKGVNLVANDWVKNRSLRILFLIKSMRPNVQSNPSRTGVTPGLSDGFM